MLSGSAKFSAPSSLHVCFCKVAAGGFCYEKEEDIKKLFLKGKNNLRFQCDILIKRENCYKLSFSYDPHTLLSTIDVLTLQSSASRFLLLGNFFNFNP